MKHNSGKKKKKEIVWLSGSKAGNKKDCSGKLRKRKGYRAA